MNTETKAVEVQPIEEKETRQTYLEALAISLGVSERLAKTSAAGLLAQSDLFEGINYRNERSNLNREQIRIIEELGEWFLTGTPLQGLKFPIGCTVLALLNEPVDSRYFKHLDSWVVRWTDSGVRADQFREIIKAC